MSLAEPVLSDINDVWGLIKPHLQNLCDKNPIFGLQPEHIYDDCVRDEANLWMTPEGFLVTRFVTDDGTGVRTLFMWVSCSFTPGADVGAKYLPFFEEVAKYMKCAYIEAWSSRVGMGRYLARQGFDEFYRSYRKAV